jgi:hypothetical protein
VRYQAYVLPGHLADLPPPLPARSAARYTPATVTTRPLGGHQAHEAGGREARNMLRTAYVRCDSVFRRRAVPLALVLPGAGPLAGRSWRGGEGITPMRRPRKARLKFLTVTF